MLRFWIVYLFSWIFDGFWKTDFYCSCRYNIDRFSQLKSVLVTLINFIDRPQYWTHKLDFALWNDTSRSRLILTTETGSYISNCLLLQTFWCPCSKLASFSKSILSIKTGFYNQNLFWSQKLFLWFTGQLHSSWYKKTRIRLYAYYFVDTLFFLTIVFNTHKWVSVLSFITLILLPYVMIQIGISFAIEAREAIRAEVFQIVLPDFTFSLKFWVLPHSIIRLKSNLSDRLNIQIYSSEKVL